MEEFNDQGPLPRWIHVGTKKRKCMHISRSPSLYPLPKVGGARSLYFRTALLAWQCSRPYLVPYTLHRADADAGGQAGRASRFQVYQSAAMNRRVIAVRYCRAPCKVKSPLRSRYPQVVPNGRSPSHPTLPSTQQASTAWSSETASWQPQPLPQWARSTLPWHQFYFILRRMPSQ